MLKRHPLKNKTLSPHYDVEGKKSNIEIMESEMSVAAMVGFIEGNIYKYESRLGRKSHISGSIKEVLDLYYVNRPEQYESFKKDHLHSVMMSDLKKIETYKAYKDVLVLLLHKGYAKSVVSYAFKQEGICFE